MNKALGIVLLSVLLSACQAQLVRVPLGDVSDVPPEIANVVDLGSLGIANSGPLDLAESDERFVAGEWAAVVGKGLNTKGARLFLDDVEVSIAGGVEDGGLLFRLPREVKFRHTYTLRVQTERGKAQRLVRVSNVVAMSDPKEERVLFWRTTYPAEHLELFEKDYIEVPCPGAGPAAVAPQGGILYVAAKGASAKQAIKTIHIAAKGGPREISSLDLDARYEAVSLVMSPDGSRAFLLTKAELLVIDLSDPLHPRSQARLDLAEPAAVKAPAYRDLVLFAQGARAAVLKEESNSIKLIDVTSSAPTVLGESQIGQQSDSSFSVSLAADPRDENILWVLTGVTSRRIGQRLSGLWSDMPEDRTPTRAAVVRLELKDNELIPGEPLNLPEGVLPLDLFVEKNGDMLISALGYEKETLAKTGLSWDGAVNLVKGMRDSLFAGRIYRVSPEGKVALEMTSINLPLSVTRMEGSPFIYSAYRLSIGLGFFSLSPKVTLTVDAFKKQSLEVREMGWKAILPPYRFMHEIVLM